VTGGAADSAAAAAQGKQASKSTEGRVFRKRVIMSLAVGPHPVSVNVNHDRTLACRLTGAEGHLKGLHSEHFLSSLLRRNAKKPTLRYVREIA
jgi:hypothetical protein